MRKFPNTSSILRMFPTTYSFWRIARLTYRLSIRENCATRGETKS